MKIEPLKSRETPSHKVQEPRKSLAVIEYVLIAALLAVVATLSLAGVSASINSKFKTVQQAIGR